MNDTTSFLQPLSHLLFDLTGMKALSAENLSLYWPGLVTTIQLTFVALVLGLCLALSFAMIRALRVPFLHRPVAVFTYLFRSTPMLIQLYMIYYGLGQLDIDNAVWRTLMSSPFWLAIVSFMLNTAAYTTEIIYGAIKTTPKGEIEAAQAYGMSPGKTMYHIVLPNAFRRALPAYGNEVIFMLHATAIASVVTLTDITGAAMQVLFKTYDGFTPFATAAVFYMLLSFTLQALFRQLEKKLSAHTQPISA